MKQHLARKVEMLSETAAALNKYPLGAASQKNPPCQVLFRFNNK
jgi:hypothetical protein